MCGSLRAAYGYRCSCEVIHFFPILKTALDPSYGICNNSFGGGKLSGLAIAPAVVAPANSSHAMLSFASSVNFEQSMV
jgi:hypothetical protein